MNKYLYVEFIDTFESLMNAVHLQIATPTRERIVKVKLTEEQVKQLTPRFTGRASSGGEAPNEYYEEMRLICIQEEVD